MKMARLLQRIVEEPHPCAYLARNGASLDVRVMVDVTPEEMDTMIERGWRRFGPCYFRPVCATCMACVTLRVSVAEFSPSRSQRRARARAARFRRVVSLPKVDSERVELYRRWHAERETSRGWEPSPLPASRYALDFAFPHPCAREVAFFDDDDGGRLVALGLFDETPRSLSAVYFYYDPALHRESLGVANIVGLLGDAKRSGKSHVYLGYRVEGCASLAYKAAYLPHELLESRPGENEVPSWRVVGASCK